MQLMKYLILAGLLLFPNISNAQEIIINKNPRHDMDANAAFTYSITNKVNELSKTNSKYLNLLTFFLEDYMAEKNSHEWAHIKTGSKYGKYILDYTMFGDMNNSIAFKYQPTDEQILNTYISGLNQNEFNAYYIYSKNPEVLPIDKAMHFLVAKLYDSRYIMTQDFSSMKNNGMLEINGKLQNWNFQQFSNDLIPFLNSKGMQKNELMGNMLVADLLTPYTWDALRGVYKYMQDGTEEVKVSKLPFVSHYMTPLGSFFDVKFIEPNKAEYSLGFGGENQLRVGYKGLKEGNINPYLYLGKGVSAGFNYTDKNFFVDVSYNNQDVIQNDVKGKPNASVDVMLGVKLEW